MHWVSWFVDSFALMGFSSLLLSILLKYGDVLSKSDATVVFCFMLCYTVISDPLNLLNVQIWTPVQYKPDIKVYFVPKKDDFISRFT